MEKTPKIVVVTGGAGQIAYSLLFQIANGALLGPEQPISLKILDIPPMEKVLQGVSMELQDCAFPLLKELQIGTDPLQLFEGAHIVLLIGANPRGPGMERKDLLEKNAKIFIEQGQALNKKADKNVLVFIVGNPCNTNALIALSKAPNLQSSQFFSMTRLDENRAKAQLALKAKAPIHQIKKVIIWGNHSSTQVPDFHHATIHGKKVEEVIKDRNWLEKDFFEIVQKRGAKVIAARGKSSAASAAKAVIDSIHLLLKPTPKGEWFSMGVFSNNNPYGIEENLFFSFPCISKGNANIEIVRDISWNSFLKEKIAITEKELIEERNSIKELL